MYAPAPCASSPPRSLGEWSNTSMGFVLALIPVAFFAGLAYGGSVVRRIRAEEDRG